MKTNGESLVSNSKFIIKESLYLPEIKVVEFGNLEFETNPLEIIELLFKCGRKLLRSDASLEDLITLIGYPIFDILNPLFRGYARILMLFQDDINDPSGFTVTWRGHEQKRSHLYLNKELALKIMEREAALTERDLYYSVLMTTNGLSGLNDGFSQEELKDIKVNSRFLIPDKKTGNTFNVYHKMFLNSQIFQAASKPRIEIRLPVSQDDYEEHPLMLPEDIRMKLPENLQDSNLTVRRVLSTDFQALRQLHLQNNPHPTLKSLDIVFPNYAIFAGGRPIAQSGSASEVAVDIEGQIIPLSIAANLVVAQEIQNLGIGTALSYATKEQSFARNSNTIILADNVETTKKMWERLYATKVVCSMGWLALRKKN